MPEERFETETILRGTTVDVERPVEVDGDGAPMETETVELPANERVEAVTCERYPEYCPRRGGLVSVEKAVVVGVDMVDRPTGRDAAVSLAYCPECATSEFAYVRDRDGGADADGRTLHERYGYLFGTEATRERPLKRLDGPGIASSLVVVALGMGLAVLGAQGLMLWAALVAATVAAAARLSDAV